jgi:hypothetical protein
MEHTTAQGEESHELVVVRLHNGEIGEDIVDLEEIDDDERIILTHPAPHDSTGSVSAPIAPGTLPRHDRSTPHH